MSRRIITTQLQGTETGSQVDGYTDRLIKYIPGDIIVAWIALTGLLNTVTDASATAVWWIVFGIVTVIAAAWTFKYTTVKDKPVAFTQIGISTGAFIVWAFALGGPFATLSFYKPLYGSIVLILYTLLVALISPSEG